MQKIVSHLWFDDQAEEAARFYTALFPNGKIGEISRYGKAGHEIHGQPEGRVMTVAFELDGYRLIALNGGPHFRFSPAVSLFVVIESEAEVDALWAALVSGGDGRAEEAITHYTGILEDSRIEGIMRYDGLGQEPAGVDPEGTVKHAQFRLEGQTFMAMDSALVHQFGSEFLV